MRLFFLSTALSSRLCCSLAHGSGFSRGSCYLALRALTEPYMSFLGSILNLGILNLVSLLDSIFGTRVLVVAFLASRIFALDAALRSRPVAIIRISCLRLPHMALAAL